RRRFLGERLLQPHLLADLLVLLLRELQVQVLLDVNPRFSPLGRDALPTIAGHSAGPPFPLSIMARRTHLNSSCAGVAVKRKWGNCLTLSGPIRWTRHV